MQEDVRTVTVTAEKPECARCGKDPAGPRSSGCGCVDVCIDHACSILSAIRPGEKYSSMEWYFERPGSGAAWPEQETAARRFSFLQ